jgi:uncharacterized coiled-coil DUF342 family protein
MSEERLGRIETRLDDLTAEVVGLKGEVGGLRGELHGTNDRIDALNQRMGVLHEEVLDRIAALAPDFTPIRREFQEADAQLLENINRRLEPLETAVRNARPRRRR